MKNYVSLIDQFMVNNCSVIPTEPHRLLTITPTVSASLAEEIQSFVVDAKMSQTPPTKATKAVQQKKRLVSVAKKTFSDTPINPANFWEQFWALGRSEADLFANGLTASSRITKAATEFSEVQDMTSTKSRELERAAQ